MRAPLPLRGGPPKFEIERKTDTWRAAEKEKIFRGRFSVSAFSRPDHTTKLHTAHKAKRRWGGSQSLCSPYTYTERDTQLIFATRNKSVGKDQTYLLEVQSAHFDCGMSSNDPFELVEGLNNNDGTF